MWPSVRDWWLRTYRRLSESYPPKWWWPIVRIYGGPDGHKDTCYMTRVMLGPKTPWGRLYLHVFHREDIDRDPHDHPFAFWTIPLNKSYIEEVFNRDRECFTRRRVPRLRLSYRPALHTHRVTHAEGGWPLVTIVWRGPTQREWGFWCHTREQVAADATDTSRVFVPFKNYVFGGEHCNIEGADQVCPAGSVPPKRGELLDDQLFDGWDRFPNAVERIPNEGPVLSSEQR